MARSAAGKRARTDTSAAVGRASLDALDMPQTPGSLGIVTISDWEAESAELVLSSADFEDLAAADAAIVNCQQNCDDLGGDDSNNMHANEVDHQHMVSEDIPSVSSSVRESDDDGTAQEADGAVAECAILECIDSAESLFWGTGCADMCGVVPKGTRRVACALRIFMDLYEGRLPY